MCVPLDTQVSAAMVSGRVIPGFSDLCINVGVISVVLVEIIERVSIDCRKTKTKAITPTNHNRSRERDEPITIPSNYL